MKAMKKEQYAFEDMKQIARSQLTGEVPIELYRTIRLIGIYQGLPMGGKGTTLTIGRKIGENLPVQSLEEVLDIFQQLKIGIPRILHQDDRIVRVAVDDCFCKGLPELDEKMVCDLEGAIMEGAINKFSPRKVTVRETKCNVHGDEHCEYEIRYVQQ